MIELVLQLSAKRKVVVSQWKGKTLISMREYYEKYGKVLPTSKGLVPFQIQPILLFVGFALFCLCMHTYQPLIVHCSATII